MDQVRAVTMLRASTIAPAPLWVPDGYGTSMRHRYGSAMTLLAALIVLTATIVGTYLIAADIYRQRHPRELRGDWWERFEAEFRAYAQSAEHRKRNRRQPGSA
jgi:uncharacterized lipoprotein YddW (UPF0748 family)